MGDIASSAAMSSKWMLIDDDSMPVAVGPRM